MAFSLDYFAYIPTDQFLPKEYKSYEEWLSVHQLVNYCNQNTRLLRLITVNNEVKNSKIFFDKFLIDFSFIAASRLWSQWNIFKYAKKVRKSKIFRSGMVPVIPI